MTENIEYFYNDYILKDVKSIICHNCAKKLIISELDKIYLQKVLLKTKITINNSEIYNLIWYPYCEKCKEKFNNIIILFKYGNNFYTENVIEKLENI